MPRNAILNHMLRNAILNTIEWFNSHFEPHVFGLQFAFMGRDPFRVEAIGTKILELCE
jgi:hypothetical protein